MPDSESRHLDAETLLFSLAWKLQAGEHWSTGGKNWLERTASNNVRGSRLCTHPSPTPWNTPRCGASGGPCSRPKPGPVHGAAGTPLSHRGGNTTANTPAAPFLYSGLSLWLALPQMPSGHLQLPNPSSNTQM